MRLSPELVGSPRRAVDASAGTRGSAEPTPSTSARREPRPPDRRRLSEAPDGPRDARRREPDDEAMLSHLATMDAFLRDPAGGDGRATSPVRRRGPTARPIVTPTEAMRRHPRRAPARGSGEVRRLDPGRRGRGGPVTLDAAGRPGGRASHARRPAGLGRRPGVTGLPVLPFTVMAEMLAQAAARLVPGKPLVGLRDVQARRWIRYEDEPVALEIVARGRSGSSPARSAWRSTIAGKAGLGDAPEVEGVVVFARPSRRAARCDRRAARVDPSRAGSRPSRSTPSSGCSTARRCRRSSEVGPVATAGSRGRSASSRAAGSSRPGASPRPLTDPIVLDAFTHLLGLWGLDRLADDGDVIFPLRLGRLDDLRRRPARGVGLPVPDRDPRARAVTASRSTPRSSARTAGSGCG